jgi:hypothetical protein
MPPPQLSPTSSAQQAPHLYDASSHAAAHAISIDRMIAHQLTPLLIALGATTSEQIAAASQTLYCRWASDQSVDLSPFVCLTGTQAESLLQQIYEKLKGLDILVPLAIRYPELPELVEIEMLDRRAAGASLRVTKPNGAWIPLLDLDTFEIPTNLHRFINTAMRNVGKFLPELLKVPRLTEGFTIRILPAEEFGLVRVDEHGTAQPVIGKYIAAAMSSPVDIDAEISEEMR